jgi:predicted MFS family arabinose efflux permease
MMGSAVYGGLVIGSILGTGLFDKMKTKHIVVLSVLCCICSLSLFIITKNIYLLFVSRFLVGFF